MKKSLLKLAKKSTSKFILCLSTLITSSTQAENNLPQLGTIAHETLSIHHELAIGDIYMRAIRSQEAVIYDPILNHYMTELGNRLVMYAQNVKTPFNFDIVKNNDLNAFAFFGGYIGLYSGLFLIADNESELASVVAHEIAHVTQRHLARAMQDMKKKQPLTTATLLGSILLTIIAPEAGIAALATTGAIAQQSSINHTRSHEIEADALGMNTLVRANFNPQGAPSFFNKLSQKTRFANTPPQILLTHPLPKSRIETARNKAHQYINKPYYESKDFLLAKARIEVRFSHFTPEAILMKYKKQAKNHQQNIRNSAQYAIALALFEQRKYKESEHIVNSLLKQDRGNLFFLDLKSDLISKSRAYAQGIKLFEQQNTTKPNNLVIVTNLANLYIENKQYKQAISLLERLAYTYKISPVVYRIMMQAYTKDRQQSKYHQTHARLLALSAQYSNAINELKKALSFIKGKDKNIESAIIKEEIKHLQEKSDIYKQLI